MNTNKIFAIVLIVAGILALIYGGFDFTRDTDAVKIGKVELTVKEKRWFEVPDWAGAGAILLGVAILAFAGGKR